MLRRFRARLTFRALRERRFRALLCIVSLAFGAALVSAVQSSEAFAESWAMGVAPNLPANARSGLVTSLFSVSCASPGNCGAVGRYTDSLGRQQGVLLTETAGTWARGVEASLPANARSAPAAYISSVSCASAGNCSAVGNYTDSFGRQQGVLLTETARTWARGVEATLPAGAAANPNVSIYSVSCAAAGNCSAVGYYTDSLGRRQGLLLTETTGTWAPGVEASLPAGAGSSPNVTLWSVSCASAGNCSAVGYYTDSSGRQQGLLLTETTGTWAPGVEASLPANATSNAGLSAVSCAAAGNCSAVGYYTDSLGHGQGLLLTETAGTWGPGVAATLPANAGSDPGGLLDSVSCAAAGNCSAVGNYTDSSGDAQGVLLTETAGSWAHGVEAKLPPDARAGTHAHLSWVSCALAGNCSAVGYYLSGPLQGLLLNTAWRLRVLKAGSGRGSVTSSPAGVKCGGSCSHSFDSGRLAKLTARPARGSGFAGWSGACSGRGNCRVTMTTERTVTARFAFLPDTKITKAKIDKAHQRAKFKFKALGNPTGFECALVKTKKHKKGKKDQAKPHFSSCSSPKSYTGLAPGGYTFLVRAFNALGIDPTPAKNSFKL